MEHLGFIFHKSESHPNPVKITAISNTSIPKDIKQVRFMYLYAPFIGLCNYYMHYLYYYMHYYRKMGNFVGRMNIRMSLTTLSKYLRIVEFYSISILAMKLDCKQILLHTFSSSFVAKVEQYLSLVANSVCIQNI